MLKCFRYLFYANFPNYPTALGFGAFIIAGCYLTGVPADGRGLFSGYFDMFPTMLLFAALFMGSAMCTTNLNHALSFGARRKDYYWAMQLLALVNTAVYTLIAAGFLELPRLLGWSADFELIQTRIDIPSYILTMLVVHSIGCVLGRLMLSHRVWAGILTGLIFSVVLMTTAFTAIVSDRGAWASWGDLPWLMVSGSSFVIFLCQFWTYGVVIDATVR